MGTDLRAEISKKSEYWLDRHRYYELKHFCLQYPVWKKAYASLDGLSRRPDDLIKIQTSGISDPTVKCAESKAFFSARMEMVEKAAMETHPFLGSYILRGVTEGLSYDKLNAQEAVPCCKDTYYDFYRRFFWLLSKVRE